MPKPTTNSIITSLLDFGINLADYLANDSGNHKSNTLDLAGHQGDLHNDSRLVGKGDVFCAIIGNDQDGRQYIEQAVKHGAQLILRECDNAAKHGFIEFSSTDNNIAIIHFYLLNQQLFALAKSYYQQPQDKMTVIGVTGTNGKTTTSQLLAQMISAQATPCAIIGTNGAGGMDKLIPIENTTPGACELHQLFNRFRDEHYSHIAMEVSSHALCQKRVLADLFDIALFTNLSRDHLDYHGSMESYGEAKKLIFTDDNNQIAVVNGDDAQGKSWIENWPNQQVLWVYGRQGNLSNYEYYVTAQKISRSNHGVSFTLISHLGRVIITSPLLGDFNVDNLLAAICVLLIQGTQLEDIPRLVEHINATAGRMETSTSLDLATAVVDYAHTPDALEKALQACKQHCEGNLYVVFGCGGDRDKGKRALMAQVAEKYADIIVVTNDNPRTENAQMIANDIVAGFTNPEAKQISVMLDREKAVLNTLAKANVGDIVLLAGKGHEDYVIVPQYDGNGVIIGTQKLAYNERAVVTDFYQQHMKSSSSAPSGSTPDSGSNSASLSASHSASLSTSRKVETRS